MPQTPDSFPGIREDEGLKLVDDGYGQPGAVGEIRYSDGYFYAQDSHGAFNLRNGGGISESEHETLDTLTHDLVENSYDETTYSGNKIINLTTYTDITKTTKIREEQITYSGNKITQSVIIQYNENGIEDYRITENITYSGNKIQNITRARS